MPHIYDYDNATLPLGPTDYVNISQSGATKKVAYSNLVTVDTSSFVPSSRTINGHSLVGNVVVSKDDLGIAFVENTALSTWPGTPYVTILGTITAGIWHGTAIGDTWIASASTWNSKAASGANTDITSLVLNQSGLTVKGSTSHTLTFYPNESLSANRTLNFKVNGADRTIDLTGNLTVPSTATVSGTNTGDQTVKTRLGPVSLTTAGGDVVAATGIDSFTVWESITIDAVYAEVQIGGTTTAIIIDINKNGISILSTKLHIDATALNSSTSVTPYVLSSTTLVSGDVISFDVDQADSGNMGAGLKVTIIGHYT